MKVAHLTNTPMAPVRRAPDNPEVRVKSLDAGGILESLFLQWNPLGKNRGPEEVGPGQVRGWLRDMLQCYPTQASARIYLNEAQDFGWRILALMLRFGIKVEIFPHASYRKRRSVKSAGIYSFQQKTVSLDEDYLERPHQSLVHHEMGHALDHLISSLCLQGQCCSTKLWHGFAPQRLAFVTAYAGKNPREYFAESVEAYFQPHSHEWLRHNDPAMHAFVTALFELSHL